MVLCQAALTVTLAPAHPSNYHAMGRAPSDVKYIVIHITDGHGAALPVAQMWQEPAHGSSAHLVIGQDGTVVQAVGLEDAAYHAHAINRSSVGIEHCARTPGELGKADQGLPVSDAQYATSAKVAAWLCQWAGLTPSRATIQGHCEIDDQTTHDDCPDAIWDWDRYMPMVVAEYQKLAQQAVA